MNRKLGWRNLPWTSHLATSTATRRICTATTCLTSLLAHLTRTAAMVPKVAQAAGKAARVPAIRRAVAESATVVRKAVAQVDLESAAERAAGPVVEPQGEVGRGWG